MADSYTELKELPELRGSLNVIVSDIRRGKRPPSLSESWAETAENIARARTLVPPLLMSEEAAAKEEDDPPIPCAFPHILLISFLFHITLISVFETLFFFVYVSTLEDAGILKTVSGFTGSLVRDCEGLSSEEKEVADWALTSLVNATAVEAKGAAASSARTAFNRALLFRAWYYVAFIAGAFVVVAAAGVCRRIGIPWRRLCLENCGLVLALGVFEGLFFTTIVYPYQSISGAEIAASTVLELQTTCGLLQPQ